MKADLHIHSNYSPCSVMSVKDIISTCKSKGLNVISITDHNTIKGSLEAKRLNPKGLKIIVGCEMKCEYGELLIYNLKKEIKCNKFEGIVKEARKQGAYIFISHPFDLVRLNNRWKNFNKNVIIKVDGLEVINGRSFNNKKSINYAKNNNKFGVAGSDSHFLEELGSTYIIFKKDLWKEVFDNKPDYFHDNSFFKKIKYLFFSFFKKRVLKNSKS